MARTKEFKVGLFTLLMAAFLYIGFNYLRGLNVFSPLNTYYVKYQNISGLNKGDKVILNGLDVGTVIERKFSDAQYSEILVELAVDKTIVLTDSTFARLAKPDFLGGVEIQLILKPGGMRVLESGDTLVGDIDRGVAELLTQEGLSAANQLSSLVSKIDDVLSPFADKSDSIAKAIDNFTEFSGELLLTTKEAKARLQQMELKMDYMADSLVAEFGGLDSLIEEYKQLGEKLNAVNIESRLQRIDTVLMGTEQFLSKLNSGEGTLGKLMSNDSLYNNLNLAMADLDSLLIDFRYNPKRYVNVSIFGRASRPPAEGREKAKRKRN
ncbi:MlaD family protein [Roseivirga pacifica]|uniref:MlaD family protein n=1 Tax=Roseivirga pacifica TaxID=1267423 RepID=UPI003BAEB0B1